MHGRSAIEGPDLLATRFIVESRPPRLQAFDNPLAIFRNFHPLHASAIRRRNIGIGYPIFDIVDGRFKEGFADAKHMMAQKSDRAVAIVDCPLLQLFGGKLPYIALRRAQHVYPLRHQFRWRQRRVTAALQADELRDILKILAEDELLGVDKHWHRAYAKSKELFQGSGVVHHISGDKINALARKKLFRLETAASAGLRI
jgi:hypothetical protein